MATDVHPMAFDDDILQPPAEQQQAHRTKRDVAQHRAFIRRVRRTIAVVAVLGLLFLLFAVPVLTGPVHELGGAAASLSGATPTHAASSAAQYDSGPIGYFPDEFVVRKWDESPQPAPQF